MPKGKATTNPDSTGRSLTPKEARFCQEYLIDLNATQAAIRAGYSKKTAKEIGFQNLTRLHVQEKIAELQKKLCDKNENLTQRVIDELAKIGFSNVQDFIDEDNAIVDISKIDKNKAAAVAGIKKSVTTFGDGKNTGEKNTVEFKLWDKGAALEKLGRHLGIFEADNSQKKAVITVNVTDDDDG